MSNRKTNARVGLAYLESAILETLSERKEPIQAKQISEDLDIPMYVIHEVLWKLKRIDRSVDLCKPKQNRYTWTWFVLPDRRASFRDSTEPEPPWHLK